MDQQESTDKDVSDPLGVSSASAVSPDVRQKEDNAGSQQKDSKTSTPSSVPSTLKSHKALDFSMSSAQSTPSHERSDHEMDLDTSTAISSLTPDELMHLYRKQEKTLSRYKTRFTEVCQFIFYFIYFRHVYNWIFYLKAKTKPLILFKCIFLAQFFVNSDYFKA